MSVEKALELYQQSLKIKVKIVRKIACHDSRDAGDTEYNISALHQGHGWHEETKQLFLECQAICAKVLGPEHSQSAQAARLDAMRRGKEGHRTGQIEGGRPNSHGICW